MWQWMFLLLMVVLVHSDTVGAMTFNNNRYDDILVAINPRVKPDPRIIRELISMFNQASPYLYRATKERAYFGNVKILIPNTWPYNADWRLSSSETFYDADIRVDHEHPSHGSDPYTFHTGRCGEPGRYIHLTPGYLTDVNQDREANYGNIGRTLVHEFAHLRYGVFDEYGLGTSDYPYVYLEDSTLYPTGCTNTLQNGNYAGNCSIDPNTNRPRKDCYFLTDRDDNSATASIMYDTSINKVVHFCESNADDPDQLHNPLAPNLHNKMCGGKGTWDVIKEHPDFKGGNSPVNKTTAEIRPTISLLYQKSRTTSGGIEICGRPVVLVLDLSGSMNFNNRYFKQTQTADKLIRDILPTGTKVGVVTFAYTATVLVPLTPLLDSSDRDHVASKLPEKDYYSGSTAIGQGLIAAKQMLMSAGETHNGRIVLITDGEENVLPLVEDIQGEITGSGIKVHTLAYGSDAATSLSHLSNETGGEYAFYTESANSSTLDSIIQELLKDISICKHQEKIEIRRVAVLLTPGQEVVQNVSIDSTVGNDTLFVFTLPHNVTVDVSLSSPNGTIYTSLTRDVYKNDTKLNIKRFQFQQAQIGLWNCSLTSTGSGSVSLVVKSLPTTEDPYEIESWMSSMFADVSSGAKPNIVYVYVHKGYSPVINADVTVTVERPSQASPVTLKPYDHGKFADTMANDGVYSAYFTQYDGNLRYSLDVEVTSVANKTVILHVQTYGGAISRYRNTTKKVVAVPAESFTRTTSPGAMDVKGFVAGKDSFAPSKINDLKVVNTDRNLRQVTLTWTAPGDDLDQGTASRYDIRMSKTAEDILSKFDQKQKVDSTMIIFGTLVPAAAGSRENVVIKAPVNWTTVVFALKTLDDASQTSDTSNIVTATFEEVTLAGQTTTTTATTASRTILAEVTSYPIDDESSKLVLILVICVIVVVVTVASILLYTLIKYLHNKKKMQRVTNPFDAKMTEPSIPNVHFSTRNSGPKWGPV